MINNFEMEIIHKNHIDKAIDSIIKKMDAPYFIAYPVKNYGNGKDGKTDYCINYSSDFTINDETITAPHLYSKQLSKIAKEFNINLPEDVNKEISYTMSRNLYKEVYNEIGSLICYCQSRKIPIFIAIVTHNGAFSDKIPTHEIIRRKDPGHNFTEFYFASVSPVLSFCNLYDDAISRTRRHTYNDVYQDATDYVEDVIYDLDEDLFQ